LLEENSTPEAVDTAGNKLIENINKKKKEEENKKANYEKEIQTKIDEAQSFIKIFRLSGNRKPSTLLEELEVFQSE